MGLDGWGWVGMGGDGWSGDVCGWVGGVCGWVGEVGMRYGGF